MARATDPTEHDPEASGLSWPVIASALVIAVIAFLAVFLVWPRSHGKRNDRATAIGSATDSSKVTSAEAVEGGKANSGDRGCAGIPASSEIPGRAPHATWSLYHGVALPSGPDLGPANVDGDIARCFAHTPVGAVVAAYTITTHYLVGPEGLRVVKRQTAAGAGQRKLIAALEEEGPLTGAGGFCQLAGYRVLSYDPAVAVIELMVGCGDGTYQANDATLQWDSTDWILQLQSDGSPGVTTEVVDRSAYTEWRGVG